MKIRVRGEPIVCTPADAFRCFMVTDTDYLILKHFLVDKKENSSFIGVFPKQELEPD